MEYVEGRTLRDVLKIEGRLMPRRAMEIVADVCAALDFSHRNGIVHRDIKPGNVMITRTGAVKVMDFGIARAVADNAATVTQTAAVIGTAQYLSPEQARGENVDARSDVYSTGVLLFELITGHPPFTGDSPVARRVPARPGEPAAAVHDQPGRAAGAGRDRAQGDGEEPGQPLPVRRRDAGRPDPGYQRPAGRGRAGDAADEVTTVLGGPRTGPVPGAGYGARVTGRRRGAAKKDRSPWFWVGIVAAALLVIAAGAFGMVQLLGGEGDEVTVPNVVGQTQAQATRTLQEAGLGAGVHHRRVDPAAEGPGRQHRPGRGVRAKKGAKVSVVVGAGPAQLTPTTTRASSTRTPRPAAAPRSWSRHATT